MEHGKLVSFKLITFDEHVSSYCYFPHLVSVSKGTKVVIIKSTTTLTTSKGSISCMDYNIYDNHYLSHLLNHFISYYYVSRQYLHVLLLCVRD